MPHSTPVRIDLDDRVLEATLALPDTASTDELATVLLIDDPLSDDEERVALLDDIAASLCDQGLAVMRTVQLTAAVESSSDVDLGQIVDQTSAVFRAIALREEVDTSRIALLGYGLGAILAACLSSRTDQIARLCLIAPCSELDVAAASTRPKEDGSGSGGAPGLAQSVAELKPAQCAAIYERPTLIVQGSADLTVAPQSSLEYRRALEAASRPVQHLFVARGNHAFTADGTRSVCVETVTRFMRVMTMPAESEAS